MVFRLSQLPRPALLLQKRGTRGVMSISQAMQMLRVSKGTLRVSNLYKHGLYLLQIVCIHWWQATQWGTLSTRQSGRFHPEKDSCVPCEAESLLGPEHAFALGVARSITGVEFEPSAQEQTDAAGSPSIHGGAVAGLPWNDHKRLLAALPW